MSLITRRSVIVSSDLGGLPAGWYVIDHTEMDFVTLVFSTLCSWDSGTKIWTKSSTSYNGDLIYRIDGYWNKPFAVGWQPISASRNYGWFGLADVIDSAPLEGNCLSLVRGTIWDQNLGANGGATGTIAPAGYAGVDTLGRWGVRWSSQDFSGVPSYNVVNAKSVSERTMYINVCPYYAGTFKPMIYLY